MNFKIGDIPVGLHTPFFVMAGPCVIESKTVCLDIAYRLLEISRKTSIAIIFKASFDKANRSSLHGFRGPGLKKGLDILSAVRQETTLPIMTDVHEAAQAGPAGRIVDCLQIPAFLCRQTDLLCACAQTDKPINVKKGRRTGGPSADLRGRQISARRRSCRSLPRRRRRASVRAGANSRA